MMLILAVALTASSCKKFVAIDPPITNPGGETVYSNDAEAAAVLTGIYGRISGNGTGFAQGANSIGVTTGLSADEWETIANVSAYHYTLYTNSPEISLSAMWQEFYQQIYVCNAAIEGLTGSSHLTPSVKQQLTGEAKFMRGFLNFYLVNLWGDVPLITTTDYTVNQSASRSPVAKVYQKIIDDLEDAKALLPESYVTPLGKTTNERTRPNKSAAKALLARIYLYTGDWAKAEAAATDVINSSSFRLVDLNTVFLKNSLEAIWQLPPVISGINTLDGNVFIRTVPPGFQEPVSLSSYTVNAFEPDDQRERIWVDSITISGTKYYYPKKYHVKGGPVGTPVTEYLMVLRLAEQFMIRAESRAQQNNPTDALTDLNVIRKRAGLPDTLLSDKEAILKAILHERQVELFTEWGHRWFDLKRTGELDSVMSVVTPLKGGQWNSNWKWYRIPDGEIEKNQNMTQNPGYN